MSRLIGNWEHPFESFYRQSSGGQNFACMGDHWRTTSEKAFARHLSLPAATALYLDV